MTEYQLASISGKSVVSLTQEQYDSLAEAREATYDTIGIEEKYDLVLANYAEYEAESMRFGVEALVYGTWFDASDANRNRRLTIGRRLLNLLAACRLYLDSTDHALCAIYGKDSEQRRQYQKSKSNCYDEHLSYRVMEQLRDHIMHRDLPIHVTGFSEELTSIETEGRFTLRFVAAIQPRRLQQDEKITPRVRDELAGLDTRTDIAPFVRQYVSDLSRIHQVVRDVLAQSLPKWDAALSQAFSLLRTSGSEHEIRGLQIARGYENGKWDRLYVSGGTVDMRRRLVARNPCDIPIERLIVVGGSLTK